MQQENRKEKILLNEIVSSVLAVTEKYVMGKLLTRQKKTDGPLWAKNAF